MTDEWLTFAEVSWGLDVFCLTCEVTHLILARTLEGRCEFHRPEAKVQGEVSLASSVADQSELESPSGPFLPAALS